MNLSQRQLAKVIGITKIPTLIGNVVDLKKGYVTRLNHLYQALDCSSLQNLYDDDFVIR